MAVLPYEEYTWLLEKLDSLLETLEIVQDEEVMAIFREGVQELAEGKSIPWEDVKKELVGMKWQVIILPIADTE